MRKKILTFSALLAAVSVIVTALLLYWAVYNDYTDKTKREIASETGYVRAAIELSGEEYLKKVNGSDTSNRITLIDRAGNVLYDNQHDISTMENHLNRPEVQRALESGTGQATRFSDTISKQTYYYAVKLNDGNILRLAITTDSVVAGLVQVVLLMVTIILLVIVAVWFIGNRMTKKIVKPINEIDLEHPQDNVIYEELTPLLFRMKQQNDVINKQVEEIKRKQIEFTALTDNMHEGFLVLDREGVILSYNKSATALLNSPFEDMSGKNMVEINREEPVSILLSKVLKGSSYEVVLAMGEKYVQVIGSPITLKGQLQGAVVVLLDITEVREREELRRAFTANVSHELKTPLTTISGYAEIMQNGIAKQEDVAKFAGKIFDEAQQMIVLIGDIITLSKLDEGSVSAAKEQVELFALAKEVAKRLEPAAQKRGIVISVQGEVAAVTGYRTILEEMVFNLVDNAVKYNREKGSVTVKVKESGGAITLAVKDTGAGIAKDERDRIFERFYRADKSRNQTEGTGLGLAIVKHGAALHNAEIALDSTVGKGTQIALKFPSV